MSSTLPPAIPHRRSAPSLTPSRKRKLSLKALTAPFRRAAQRSDPPLSDQPPNVECTLSRSSTRTPSILSRKLRRKSLVSLEKPEGSEEAKVFRAGGEKAERRRSGSGYWSKRTVSESLPSEAASIRAAWIHQQQGAVDMSPLEIRLDTRASLSSVGSLRFPVATPDQRVTHYLNAPQRQMALSASSGPTHAPSTASASSRTKPFLSPPASAIDLGQNNLAVAAPVTPSATSEGEEDHTSYRFPLRPPRDPDLPTPPASPTIYICPSSSGASSDGLPAVSGSEEGRYQQPSPLNTPPHTPVRNSLISTHRPSPPGRPGSSLSSSSTMTTSAGNRVQPRPVPHTSSTTDSLIPIFTRGSSPFARLSSSLGRPTSVLTSSSSTSISTASGLGSTTSGRRPISIAPQLGSRRLSAAFASGGLSSAATVAVNRQSWASVRPQSVGGITTGQDGLDGSRQKVEERDRRTHFHRRTDSSSTITADKGKMGKWQPVEGEIAEKENVGKYPSTVAEVDEERRRFEAEAEALLSDERMQALVRELGI
ncbi:hypothetical protein JCM11641_006773 [Rhodosporidiobolus odoratus]